MVVALKIMGIFKLLANFGVVRNGTINTEQRSSSSSYAFLPLDLNSNLVPAAVGGLR